ncbi:cyclase family protein [Nodularia chucula]|uniref:cyclase family protein n=1 Tax=Nodularia chucula TaxID=3093667 RepID=UPI0039C6B64E
MNKNQHTITYSQVIHLSQIIDTNIPQWPGDPPVEFSSVAHIPEDGYYLRRFSLGEHSATHINAPKSFHENGVGIDQYSAESLVLPGVVIDICTDARLNSDYTLTVTDVLAWEEKNGKIAAGSLVLLYTGWQDKWLDKDRFFNQDESGIMHFPGFSYNVTQFLLAERKIAGLGIDTHGVDPGKFGTFEINYLVLAQQGIVLENLTNLNYLPAKGITVIIGVLRLRDGSGCPVGVLALSP